MGLGYFLGVKKVLAADGVYSAATGAYGKLLGVGDDDFLGLDRGLLRQLIDSEPRKNIMRRGEDARCDNNLARISEIAIGMVHRGTYSGAICLCSLVMGLYPLTNPWEIASTS